MESELVRHLRAGAEAVRQLNSAAPEGRVYSLTVEEEGVAVHVRQRRHQARLLSPWDVLEQARFNPLLGLLADARKLLMLRIEREGEGG